MSSPAGSDNSRQQGSRRGWARGQGSSRGQGRRAHVVLQEDLQEGEAD